MIKMIIKITIYNMEGHPSEEGHVGQYALS